MAKVEADGVTKMVQYKGTGATETFWTRKHDPFKIMCGHCNYMGFTTTRESVKCCSPMGLICLYEIPEWLGQKLCCEHRLHRSDHLCRNCNKVLAYALYKRSEKIRGWFDGWALEEFEMDTQENFKEVAARKKKENEERKKLGVNKWAGKADKCDF